MNARDVITDAINDGAFRSDRTISDCVLDGLAAAGFVVVACPPGSRVVVSRESKPCPREATHTIGAILGKVACDLCGGSGVVEATTIHGLERLEVPRQPYWALAALPEDAAR